MEGVLKATESQPFRSLTPSRPEPPHRTTGLGDVENLLTKENNRSATAQMTTDVALRVQTVHASLAPC